MEESAERIIKPGSVLVIVASALLGSHAMDVGELLIAVYDALRLGGVKSHKEFRVEGGLIVAGVGFVVLLATRAKTAAREGRVKNYETLLASLVTGFLGLAFSIIDKTVDEYGLPTAETARGLIFVLIGACVLLPPFLAHPWTSPGFSRAARVLSRIAAATVLAFLAGLLIQAGYRVFSWICEGACAQRYEQSPLPLGGNRFFISAPSAAGFIAGMAVLISDPWVRKDRWPQLSRAGRGLWALGFFATSSLLSLFYALGVHYPKHGKQLDGDLGWMHSVAGFELNRLDTVFLFWSLHLPALVAAVIGLARIPVGQGGRLFQGKDILRLALGVGSGAAGALLVVRYLDPLGVLAGKETPFIAAHVSAAVVAAICPVLVYRRAGRKTEASATETSPDGAT